MKKPPSHLEDLPNELLTDVFKNLDARDLFRAFSHLNLRLTRLIRSFQYLRLRFHVHTSNAIKINEESFPCFVHTLLVDPWINFNLHRFHSVRRLTLNSPLPHILEQLKPESMPFLEYLSVSYMFNMYEIVLLHNKIFSNSFPHLSSCELLEKETVMTIQSWTSTPSIGILKVDLIDGEIFAVILSACPNLRFFKFAMLAAHLPSNVPIHSNVERLSVELRDPDWSYDDHILNSYLACLPNVRSLQVHRRRYGMNIDQYLQHYDWFKSIINLRLPVLKRFQFSINVKKDELFIGSFSDQLRAKCQDTFSHIHQDLPHARLRFF